MRKWILSSLLTVTITAQAAVNQETVSGLNQFAFLSHQHLYQPGTSAVYSPYSIGVLLEMLVNGSAGQTREELMHAFGLNNTDSVNSDIDALNGSLSKNKDVIISNAFWIDKHFNFNPTYMNSIKKMQSVTMHPVDFAAHGSTIKDQINDWAEKATKGYIKNLMMDPLSAETKLVLTNAVYFKGLWTLPFDAKQTAQEAFTGDDSSKKMVSMMHRSDRYHYTENGMLQMLVLDYNQSSLALALILPKAGKSLQAINESITPDQFKLLCDNAQKMPQQVEVSIPKFKIESRFTSELKRALTMAGIHDAFDPAKANFANLVAAGNGDLYISDTIQKAVIEVDEKGTVAAAASAVVSLRSAVIATKPLVFHADHPFMFVIFDKVTGLILFMGEMQ
jgi:serine protease inhibitor